MRVFNVRLAAILLGSGLVFCVGVYFLHRFQVQRNATFFRDASEAAEQRAAEAAKDKDVDAEAEAKKDAVKCLSWYVSLNAKDYKAMERLGIMLADAAQQGDIVTDRQTFSRANGMLETVVRLDPTRTDARRRLVKMAMLPQVRRYQDARDHLERFLLTESPADPELLEQLAQCQAAMNSFDLAEASFKKSIANGRDQVTAYAELAELLRYQLNQPKEADQWIDKLVKVNSKSYKAHLFRGRYLMDPKLNRSDEALEEASKALQLAPDDVEVLEFAAKCYAAKKKYDKARDCVAHGIKLYPTNVLMYGLLSDIELRVGDHDKAIAALQKGIKATDRNVRLLWGVANLLVDVNKLEESSQILDELQTRSYPRSQIDYIRARIEFVQGHWRRALEGLENVRGSLILEPQYVRQIDVWIAQCYRQLGNRDQQEQALHRALTIDPSYAPAKQALAELAKQKGNLDEAQRLYGELLAGRQIGSAGAIQEVRLLLLRTAGQSPSQRDWTLVEKALDAAEKSLPGSPDILVLRANMLVVQDRAADAEKLLLEARDKNRNQIILWAALIMLAERDSDWDKAEKLLAESEKALGDSVDQRLTQAQYFVQRGGKDASLRLRKLAENADRFPESERLKLWDGLLTGARRLGDAEQAVSLAQKIAAMSPDNAQVRYLLFERALGSGDQAATERALKDVEVVAGQDWYWYYGQAMLLCMQAKDRKDAGPLLDQALGFLKKARELRKDWSRIPLTEGGIYDQLGKFDLALQRFREAFAMGERNPTVIQRTIQLLFQTQQFAEADRLLRKLESEQGSLSAKLTQAAAESALQQGDASRALEKARKAVSVDSKDYMDQLWLGQVLGNLGNQAKARGQPDDAWDLFGDAEKAFRRAAELEPKRPVVWVALVRFFHATGEDAKAEAVIQEAETNLPANDAPLALGQCYEFVNKPNMAQEKYEAALKLAPQETAIVRIVADFYRRAGKLPPAETLLQKILDGKVPAKEADVVWARRQLATILAARDDYKDLLKAQELIQENLASPEASVADRELIAKLQASDPKQGQRDKALATLEAVVQGPSATAEDRLALAKMYLNKGDWIRASDLLRGLVAANDKDPRFLALYIDALLKHNEVASVEEYYIRLEQLAPNWFITASLKADWLCATNRPLEAFETLKTFSDNPEGVPQDRNLRLRLLAENLDRLSGQMTKPEQASVAAQCINYAESLLRDYVKENPGQELVLALFLGTHTKVDEALDLIEGNLPTATVDDLSQAFSLIVERGKSNKEQLQRLSQIMQSALKKYERPTALLLPMAQLRARQTLYPEAIDTYREALGKTPNNSTAMNNLAVLQALQGVKLDESLTLVNKAIEIAGPLGPMLDSRATVYMALKNPEKAIEDMKASLLDQETPVKLFHLAQAYALSGDDAKARTTMDTALQKGLAKESLEPLEWPVFEKLRKLPR